MKRFQFGPERVRLWRDRQAEVEELRLKQLQLERQRLVLQKEAMQAEARTAEESVRRDTRILADDLANLDSFRQFVRSRTMQLESQKTQCETRIAQQQKRAAEARRAAELLDRLKTKRLAEWRTSYAKEEENLSSELFLARRKRPSKA